MTYFLKEVLKGNFIYIFGQIIRIGSAFFLIPIYTNLLSTEEYGIIGYCQVIINVLLIILLVAFHGSQTRFYYDNKDKPKEIGSYLFSTNIFLFSISAIYLLIATFYGRQIFNMLNIDIPYDPYIKISLYIPPLMVFNMMMISFYLAKKEHIKNAGLHILLFFFTTLSIILFLLVFNFKAEGYLLGGLLGNALFFVCFYLFYAKNFKCNLSIKHIKNAFFYGFPLVFHLLSSSLHNMIDRVILEKYIPMSEIGIYTLGYQIGIIIAIIATAFNKSFKPNFYELLLSNEKEKTKKYETRKIYSIWLFFFTSITLLGILFSKEFLYLFASNDFYSASSIAPFIMISSFFSGLYYFASSPLFYYKKTKIIPVITFLSFALNLMLNLMLIPEYGIYGALFATIISHFFLVLIFYHVGKKYFDPGYNIKFTGFSIFLLFLSLITVNIEIGLFVFAFKMLYFIVVVLILLLMIKKEYNLNLHTLLKLQE